MFILLAILATGDAPAASPTASATVMSLNFTGVMGFTNLNVGRMSIGIEHVVKGRHGFMIEGGTIHLHGDPAHLWGTGGALMYRHHFGGATDAPFMGIRLAAEAGDGRYLLEPDGSKDDPDANIKLSMIHFSGTAHVGYRWNLMGRLDLTIRLGAGYGNSSFTTHSEHSRNDEAIAYATDRWQLFPVVMDSELSLGIRLGKMN